MAAIALIPVPADPGVNPITVVERNAAQNAIAAYAAATATLAETRAHIDHLRTLRQ
jgi:hypothetical protein